MNRSIKYVFDAAASDNDRQRKQLIPCFDDFYGIAVSCGSYVLFMRHHTERLPTRNQTTRITPTSAPKNE